MTDFENKVKNWLEEQGYPLEMKVAEILKNAGFKIAQSAYYTDPEKGKPREIDVVADMNGEWVDYFISTFVLAIECKKSHNRPWVVFSSKPKYPNNSLLDIGWVASKAGTTFRKLLWKNKKIRSDNFHFWSGQRGFSVTEAFTTGKDTPYQAIMSAANYANNFIAKTDSKELRKVNNHEVVYSSLVHPVIVLDGKLLQASLDESEKLKVKEIDEAIVYHRYPFSETEQDHTLIRIIRIDRFKEFVDHSKQTIERFINSTKQMKATYEKTIES